MPTGNQRGSDVLRGRIAEPNVKNRTLLTGDKLDVMGGIDSDSADLILLDPPFNSNRDYEAPIGSEAAGRSINVSCIGPFGRQDRQMRVAIHASHERARARSRRVPVCGTTIRPGAIVCAAWGAFKDKRMGCTGCLALFGAVRFSIGVLIMVALVPESIDRGAMGFIVLGGLVYAGLAALCYWALAKKRRLKWYRRM